MRKTFFLMAATLVTAAVGGAQTPAAASGDAKHGKDLYVKDNCYACHGFSGQNGNGARLVPMKFAEAGFIAYVRNPPRANQMPSFSPKVLSDRDLADIYAYIRSLPNSDPPPASVPILSKILSENK